jgi:Flp pilus assembly protein TadG
VRGHTPIGLGGGTNESYPATPLQPDTPLVTTQEVDRPRMRLIHPRTPDAPAAERGQSLVEFALVLMPLFLILLGIIQFGFVFNSYVTITNAAREGARTGTVYLYDGSYSKAQNDLLRNEAIKTSLIASMNLLGKTSPNFTTSASWTQSGLTFTNGDLVITYLKPASVTETDARVGQQVTVRATYHQDLIIPLVSNLLPKDAGGRLALTSEVTMVVN